MMNDSAPLWAVFENGGKGAKFSNSSSCYMGLTRWTFSREKAVILNCIGGAGEVKSPCELPAERWCLSSHLRRWVPWLTRGEKREGERAECFGALVGLGVLLRNNSELRGQVETGLWLTSSWAFGALSWGWKSGSMYVTIAGQKGAIYNCHFRTPPPNSSLGQYVTVSFHAIWSTEIKFIFPTNLKC